MTPLTPERKRTLYFIRLQRGQLRNMRKMVHRVSNRIADSRRVREALEQENRTLTSTIEYLQLQNNSLTLQNQLLSQ